MSALWHGKDRSQLNKNRQLFLARLTVQVLMSISTTLQGLCYRPEKKTKKKK